MSDQESLKLAVLHYRSQYGSWRTAEVPFGLRHEAQKEIERAGFIVWRTELKEVKAPPRPARLPWDERGWQPR